MDLLPMKKKQIARPNFTFDLWCIIFYEIFAAFSTVAFNLKFYQSSLLFFFIPGVFLLLRKTKKLKHILIACAGGLGFGFIFDFFATFNAAWYIPTDQLSIPYRILGIVPLDDLIWFVSWLFFMTTFYEHFLDTSRSKKLSRHLTFAVVAAITLPLILCLMYIAAPQLLAFKFAYLLVAVFLIPFFIFMLYHKPTLILTYLKLTVFFAPLCLLFEITGLTRHQWVFPGYYIGHVELLGLTMPFEEFFFWILLSSSVVLSYYEFFVEER